MNADPTEVLSDVCSAVAENRVADAAEVLRARYPFVPLEKAGRKYSERESMAVFVRDGFIDRYSGERLVFPGTLRLLSKLLPEEFPFHQNWKTDECHQAYWEIFPTIDHVKPITRNGADDTSNWVSTSMLRNLAKSNFTLDKLGWLLCSPGSLAAWDGLTSWCIDHAARRQDLLGDAYLRRWLTAAKSLPPYSG